VRKDRDSPAGCRGACLRMRPWGDAREDSGMAPWCKMQTRVDGKKIVVEATPVFVIMGKASAIA
jgi:hypothetical protein